MSIVYIAIGSNINPEANVKRCLDLLAEMTTVLAVSSIYQTPPTGYLDQDDFLNLAVVIETELEAQPLRVQVLDHVEQLLGRVRDPQLKSGPRTIDLDIALWDDAVFDYGPRHVPHPDVVEFAHTVLPLAELAPEYVHPETAQPLAEIAQAVSKDGIFKREDLRI